MMVPLLAGCGSEKKYKIGVSQCSQDDWRVNMNSEIMREAMFHDDVEIEIRSADDSNEKQISDIRYFADNGFDIIIAAPNEAEPVTPVIDEVMARDIPVVVFDRNVTGDNYTAYQGADNDSIGLQAAQYVNSLTGGNAKVIEIQGNPGSTPTAGRHAGFSRGIGAYEGISVVGTGCGNWNYDRAVVVADSLLRLHPDASVVYAHNDRMAVAASDVAARLGLHPYIIGIDAAPEIGMKAVAEGKIDATFLYPTDGYRLVRTALAILKGEPYSRVTCLPATSAVDRSNADILMLQNESLKEETDKIKVLKSQVDRYWDRHNLQTALLYSLVAILVLLFVFLFLFLRAFWQKQRQQKLLEEKNSELERQRDMEKSLNLQLQEATQAKLMFFTNVSHDLRTPLTLIAEPVRQLKGATHLTPQQSTLVRIADKNVKILQRLINQILDFRKYENGKLDLNLSEVDLCRLVDEWTDAFNDVARRRHMRLTVECPSERPAHVALDVEKIERVFFNLLSNAFKYTPDNGDIKVVTTFTDSYISLSISDTGRGISAEDMKSIFDRFYQVDKVHPNGSGIGLSLAKAFVELHAGTISVESEPGKGSVFTVRLPIRHVADRAEAVSSGITDRDVTSELSRVDAPVLPVPADDTEVDEEDKPLLLVIDDNEDIQQLVAGIMGEHYRVMTAANGADGVRMAAKYVPDLVISDVMMPVMDGMECCRRIKAEVSTSHIPVLMLTACSMDEQRVEGYDSGADGYVSKPFNSEVLRARCESLIRNRRLIRDLWRNESAISAKRDGTSKGKDTEGNGAGRPANIPAAGEIDNDFYNRFLGIFRERMADPDINIDSLAADMGLGRSQFYRKIKALTNFSPVELIRKLRLQEARNQLLTTEKTVSEIAYGIGFSTPAYFTKCYREAFGETPSETRTNLTKV